MASIQSTARTIMDKSSIESRARRLYDEVLADIKKTGIRTRETAHGLGYMWNGSISQLAHACFPELTIEVGRTGPASKQLLNVVKKHLADSKNVIWVQERVQYYVSPEYKEARVKKGARVVPIQESIADRAKRVWERARAYSEAENHPTETHGGVDFWQGNKPLALFMKAEFPELYMPSSDTQPFYEKYRRPLYDLLRATTNAVNVGSKHFEEMKDGEHHWLIRKDWHDSHEAYSQIFPDYPEPKDEAVTVKSPTVKPPAEVSTTPVEAMTITVEANSIDPIKAVGRLYQLVKDAETLHNLVTEQEQTILANTATIADLRGQLTEKIDGTVILELLEGVLAKIYDGSIGMSRAVADVEDIVKEARG